MRSRFIAASSLVTLLAACGGGDGIVNPGDQDLADFILAFCTGEAPALLAFQNEGGAWTKVTLDASNKATVKVTKKVGFAFVDDQFGDFLTEVIYATRDELAPFNNQACTASGTKVLNGSVSGLSGAQGAKVSIAENSDFLFQNSTWQLDALPSGAVDLVASRSTFTQTGEVPDKVIVRRALTTASGGTVADLNFNAAEALAVTTNTVTITGLTTGDEAFLDVSFSTAGGTHHSLFSASTGMATSATIYGVPMSLTQTGDVHALTLEAGPSAGTTFRGVVNYYRTAANQTAAIGANVNTPTISTIATSPSLRMRAALVSQAEYGSWAAVGFVQQGTVDRFASVIMTTGYAGGTPATWTLDMPDLTGISGYPTGASLVNGVTTDWSVFVGSSNVVAFIGAVGADGTSVKFAARASSSSGFDTQGITLGASQPRESARSRKTARR